MASVPRASFDTANLSQPRPPPQHQWPLSQPPRHPVNNHPQYRPFLPMSTPLQNYASHSTPPRAPNHPGSHHLHPSRALNYSFPSIPHPMSGVQQHMESNYLAAQNSIPTSPMLAMPQAYPNQSIFLIPSNYSERRADWSAHTDSSGRNFYHNQVTHVSTYEKPEILKTLEESSLPPCAWVEYTTPSGEKYYYDGKNSLWEEPAEHKENRMLLEKLKKQQEPATPEPTVTVNNPNDNLKEKKTTLIAENQQPKESPNEKKPLSPPKVVEFETHEQAVTAFKQLLIDQNISSTIKFAEIQKICSNFPNWNALKTQGERKQAVNEYQMKKMKEEKEEKRQKARKARDNFLKMLAENTKITSSSKWAEGESILARDPRFLGVEDMNLRQELFDEFVIELAKRERQERIEARKVAIQNLKQFLRDHARMIHRKSNWLDVSAKFQELNDPRFFGANESDRIKCFKHFIQALEQRHQKKIEKKMKARNQVLEKYQKGYEDMLKSMIELGHINQFTRWSNVIPLLENSEEFINLNQESSSIPRNLFRGLTKDLQQQYEQDKNLIRMILQPEDIQITIQTKFYFFLKKIVRAASENIEYEKKLNEAISQRIYNIIGLYEELKNAILSSESEKRIWQKKKEKKFDELLNSIIYRSDQIQMKWQEAKAEMQQYPEFNDLTEKRRFQMFQAHMKKLLRIVINCDLRNVLIDSESKKMPNDENDQQIDDEKTHLNHISTSRDYSDRENLEMDETLNSRNKLNDVPNGEDEAEISFDTPKTKKRKRRSRTKLSSRSKSRSGSKPRSKSKSHLKLHSRSRVKKSRSGTKRKHKKLSRSNSFSNQSSNEGNSEEINPIIQDEDDSNIKN